MNKQTRSLRMVGEEAAKNLSNWDGTNEESFVGFAGGMKRIGADDKPFTITLHNSTEEILPVTLFGGGLMAAIMNGGLEKDGFQYQVLREGINEYREGAESHELKVSSKPKSLDSLTEFIKANPLYVQGIRINASNVTTGAASNAQVNTTMVINYNDPTLAGSRPDEIHLSTKTSEYAYKDGMITLDKKFTIDANCVVDWEINPKTKVQLTLLLGASLKAGKGLHKAQLRKRFRKNRR